MAPNLNISGIADFMGYPGINILICPQDPSEPAKLGYHANKYVSIWDNGNRESVTVASYMSAIEAMKPNAFVALCDGETPKDCQGKRIAKAVAQTINCLDETLVARENAKVDCPPILFGAFEGGYDVKARRMSAEQIVKR